MGAEDFPIPNPAIREIPLKTIEEKGAATTQLD
jgi:hypothetical protein